MTNLKENNSFINWVNEVKLTAENVKEINEEFYDRYLKLIDEFSQAHSERVEIGEELVNDLKGVWKSPLKFNLQDFKMYKCWNSNKCPKLYKSKI